MRTTILAATTASAFGGFGYSLYSQGVDKTINDTKKIGNGIIVQPGQVIYSAQQTMVTDIYSLITTAQQTMVTDIYSLITTPIIDFGSGVGKVISSIYNATPAKETVGNVTSTAFSWPFEKVGDLVSTIYQASPAKETVGNVTSTAFSWPFEKVGDLVSTIYQASPAKETSGNVIKDIVTGGWTGITTSVSDTYSAIKTPVKEFTDIDSNNLSAGVGITAGAVAFSSLLGASAGIPLSIVVGTAGFGVSKGFLGYAEKFYGFNGQTTQQSNTIVNDANNLNKLLISYPVYSTYKNDVFSMNTNHAEKFTEIRDNLKTKYLDEIEYNVDNFDTQVDFCKSEEDDIVNIYSIMHYTHNQNKLSKDWKLKEPNKGDISQQSYGEKFYDKHFNKDQISNDKEQICKLRSEINQKFSNIDQTEYITFCNSHADEPLCSDFVKDIIFPELVEFVT